MRRKIVLTEEQKWYLAGRWSIWGNTWGGKRMKMIAKISIDNIDKYNLPVAVTIRGNFGTVALPKVVMDLITDTIDGKKACEYPEALKRGMIDAQVDKFISKNGNWPFCNHAHPSLAHCVVDESTIFGLEFLQKAFSLDGWYMKQIGNVFIFNADVYDETIAPRWEGYYNLWFTSKVNNLAVA